LFLKILIANRGEIAVRVMQACRKLGIKTVAVYSEADKDSLHVRSADKSVCIGKPPSRESYLNIPAIISAAQITKSEAIHPGYGFLSENAYFAEICAQHNIVFIGPPPKAISRMGDKAEARETMRKAKVPVVPGSKCAIKETKEAIKEAQRIGYPVMIKAVAGGGGKGMRIAHDTESLVSNLSIAQTEAQSVFGNQEVYIEKYLDHARHIEVQILADKFGHTVHLRERECSIQRRHQKLIEESPSPALDEKLREDICQSAVRAAKSVKYFNAGTLEFIFDQQGKYYFMEMNTRIQVEHPVTEMITGIDIVSEQIRIAANQKLEYRQKDITCDGHAIECRINAEDPYNNFLPSPGKITAYRPPRGPGIRLDTHIYEDYTVPPFYDSLLAKLIVHGETRSQAIEKMQRALEEFVIKGVKTTIPFHLEIFSDVAFQKGDYSTRFIEDRMDGG